MGLRMCLMLQGKDWRTDWLNHLQNNRQGTVLDQSDKHLTIRKFYLYTSEHKAFNYRFAHSTQKESTDKSVDKACTQSNRQNLASNTHPHRHSCLQQHHQTFWDISNMSEHKHQFLCYCQRSRLLDKMPHTLGLLMSSQRSSLVDSCRRISRLCYRPSKSSLYCCSLHINICTVDTCSSWFVGPRGCAGRVTGSYACSGGWYVGVCSDGFAVCHTLVGSIVPEVRIIALSLA